VKVKVIKVNRFARPIQVLLSVITFLHIAFQASPSHAAIAWYKSNEGAFEAGKWASYTGASLFGMAAGLWWLTGAADGAPTAFYAFLVGGTVGGAVIAGTGLVILEAESHGIPLVHYGQLDSAQANKIGLSPAELATFNATVPFINGMSDEVTVALAGSSLSADDAPKFSQSKWKELLGSARQSGLLSAEALEVWKKVALYGAENLKRQQN
jgi:hypothetical protein